MASVVYGSSNLGYGLDLGMTEAGMSGLLMGITAA
jgi:hypothetical protein